VRALDKEQENARFWGNKTRNPSAEQGMHRAGRPYLRSEEIRSRPDAGVQGEGRRGSGGPDRGEEGRRRVFFARRPPPLRISSSCAEDVGEHGERSTEHAGMQQL
jgi:hypothetical protein